jgi:hypothetical protein
MAYNERYQVKRLSPEDRRRDAEIAVRKKLVGAKKRHQADDEDDLYDDEDWEETPGPLATITKRYDTPVAVVTPRRTRVDHYRDDPYFTHAPAVARKKLKVHWLVYAGVCLLLIVVCHYLFNDLGAWWQDHQDYSNYGMPRMYQTDAVVGHNDSSSNPSHFEAENIRGHIIVIELPGDDASKSRVYSITTEMNGNASVPVTINFQDVNGDGKLDMVVVVGDPGSTTTFTLYNDGTQFVSKL